MTKAHSGSSFCFVAIILSCLIFTATSYAQKVKVLVTANYVKALQPLVERHPNLQLVAFRTGDDILKEVADADAIVGLAATHPADKIVAAGKKLRWIQTGSAGVEEALSDPIVRDSKIILTNAKIIMGPEIADHALALLLNHTRDLKFHNEQMATVGFQRRNRLPQIELRGKTVLIIWSRRNRDASRGALFCIWDASCRGRSQGYSVDASCGRGSQAG